MVVVPGATPVTMPVAEPIVAQPGLLLVHTPPEGELVSVVLVPTQMVSVPEMPEGSGLTVTWATM